MGPWQIYSVECNRPIVQYLHKKMSIYGWRRGIAINQSMHRSSRHGRHDCQFDVIALCPPALPACSRYADMDTSRPFFIFILHIHTSLLAICRICRCLSAHTYISTGSSHIKLKTKNLKRQIEFASSPINQHIPFIMTDEFRPSAPSEEQPTPHWVCALPVSRPFQAQRLTINNVV